MIIHIYLLKTHDTPYSIADKENKKAIVIMGEGSLPFIALDFLLQEGEFMLSLVLSLNYFVACQ